MFKSLGDLIHRTSWWWLIGGGLFVLVGLVLFAAPIHLLRLPETGRTAAERSAIKREINLAFGDRALTIAEAVVRSMKSRSADPERMRELDSALAEMERARAEIERARSDVGKALSEGGMARRDAAKAARAAAAAVAQSALDTATGAAEAAVEAATDAREGIEQARDDAIEKLKEKGVNTASTQRSFDELLRNARENERNAREALAAIKALPKRGEPPPVPGVSVTPDRRSRDRSEPAPAVPAVPDAPAVPAPPGASSGDASTAESASSLPSAGTKSGREPLIVFNDGAMPQKKGLSIHFDTNDAKGTPPVVLPPEMRRDIRNKVAGDVWRVGIGSGLILIYVPLFMMLLIAKYLIGRSRRALAFAEEKNQEAKVSDINRQITEARLQALQAQIEPHFLYNTLANVQALTEFDPPAANAMVGHLIQYLRAALPKMRESTSTVGQEVELVRAYLNILKMRMGARLDFGIDMPDALARRPFPPMMLPSLVENAIKHGLEPMREGGRIDVVVSQVSIDGRDRIRVEVRDTGRGLSDLPPAVGGGVGLTNLRERLKALHGDDARFTLEANTPRGAIATIEVPLQMESSVGAASAQPSAPLAAAAPIAAIEPPARGWRRAWRATSRTHSVWASIMSKLFFVLMIILAGAFALSLIALYTGTLPMNIGNLELEGIEGKALGSLMLLAAFAASAVAIAIVVAMFYGLGFVFAALLIIVPAAILVFLFPVLAPFLVVGLIVWWFLRRRRRRLAALAESAKISGSDPFTAS
nr:autolysin sensor kinase [uncultured bacterium]